MNNLEWLASCGFAVATDGEHAAVVRLDGSGEPIMISVVGLDALVQGIRDHTEVLQFEEMQADAAAEYTPPVGCGYE